MTKRTAREKVVRERHFAPASLLLLFFGLFLAHFLPVDATLSPVSVAPATAEGGLAPAPLVTDDEFLFPATGHAERRGWYAKKGFTGGDAAGKALAARAGPAAYPFEPHSRLTPYAPDEDAAVSPASAGFRSRAPPSLFL
ncbi:hypothetical protein KYK29_11785 [Shinella daejeonensis]|uniref:hypothetical protein n=1 Tax=Shinella daejeonensis TaxID=659017 RepID=UPI0020C7E0C4|nr:hypothetical protein [Shinella daejeonensis]MCP8895601.1 hypothetical protein [Shinella daejeonensis]